MCNGMDHCVVHSPCANLLNSDLIIQTLLNRKNNRNKRAGGFNGRGRVIHVGKHAEHFWLYETHEKNFVAENFPIGAKWDAL